MKSKLLIAVPMLLGLAISSHANPIVGITAPVSGTLGANFFFNNASTGGSDTAAVNQPNSATFTRSFGVLNVGTGGSTINITGMAWASLASATSNDATNVSVTVTYLGLDGVFGGVDDVVIGTSADTFTYAGAASLYGFVFTTAMSAVIDGQNNQFRIVVTPTNTGGSLSFKNSSGTVVGANTKLSLAGTSTIVGSPLTDTDSDGLPDAYENNSGIYVSAFNTGTNPNDADTDDDFYLDGVETNTGTFVSTSNTGTSPFKPDGDNDGLLDGVETNTGTFVSISNTGTSPFTRDRDNDRLSDKYEVDNGLNAFSNADFDGDTFSDALEVLFYSSNPKSNLSFPGDGTSPGPGTFTPILNVVPGVAIAGSLSIPSTLGTAIINEAALGGSDADYSGANPGVTDFVIKYPNAFPAAGSPVSITGFAWPVSSGVNASGDILLQFFDPGADGVIDGIDKDLLVGTARGTLTTTGVTNISYWNFAPINFTSLGTGLMVKIQSTAALRIKYADNVSPADGQWYTNTGLTQFGAVRESLFSIGGTNGGPGPVESFVISAISSPQPVDAPITGITITAKDASNATATSFTGTVTFGGTAGVTGTSANFVAGVLTGVSVTPTVEGTDLTLTVVDGATHTGSATFTTVAVGPGPVDSFEISAIGSPQTVGTPITGITITAKDASSATATGFTGTVTFGGTAGCTGTSVSFVAGVLSGVSVTPTVAGSSLTLTVDDGALHTGSATITTVQTQFAAWSGGPAFNIDTNNDSVTNGVAWVSGAANPAANAIALLPTFDNTSDPAFFIFNYRRADVANTAANTTITVQYGSNLTGWTTAVAGADVIITPTDNFYGVSPGIDKVEVKIRRTLAVGSRLFARLNVVQAP